MMNIILFIMFLYFLSLILFLINFFISKKTTLSQEKMSPFECGFNPSSSARLPFSTQFFLISLIFLIFDIEITLLLPLIFLTLNFNPFIIFYSFMFLFILIIGLYIEYNEYSLDWKMI
uniref:NADH-ubiquinone oxidoreductase chain 3 n=1 Tax=Atta opaciceps TaxID=592322 RepID=A0A249RWP9_9HYME|nr:NADH dehydrogenase subunit 3 [Atta opaciceps]